MKLWIMTRCALVAVLALAWSCSDEETGPIGVAVVGPLTGDASHVGEQIRNVTEMVLEESGGEVRGRQIIPVYVDSQSDPDLAAEAYREVIQDPENNIVSGFFNWHSDVSVSLMDVAADEDMAHVCALGATGEINDKVEADPERYEGWSKGWPTPSKLAQNYITAISDAIEAGTFSPSELNAAVYGEDTSWGRSFGEAIRVGLEDAGWTIVAEIYLPQPILIT
jgi:branched-chain amino acid transport system substrate-binding protein